MYVRMVSVNDARSNARNRWYRIPNETPRHFKLREETRIPLSRVVSGHTLFYFIPPPLFLSFVFTHALTCKHLAAIAAAAAAVAVAATSPLSLVCARKVDTFEIAAYTYVYVYTCLRTINNEERLYTFILFLLLASNH